MARERTVTEKVADAMTAFEAFRYELTPPALRTMMEQLTAATPQDHESLNDLDAIQAYLGQVNAAVGASRLVFANDRAALIAAVMLTQSGVARPMLDVVDGGGDS